MPVLDVIHIGKIIYAIDHNTELLREGALFKKVEIDSKSDYLFVLMSFDGMTLNAKYITGGRLELFKLVKGNNGFFNVVFETYNIRQGVSYDQAVNPSPANMIARVTSRFNDLRRVEYEYRSAATRQVERNKLDRAGEVIPVQFRTVAGVSGIAPDLFTECVSAFRSFIRNKANNVLKDSELRKDEQADKTRLYQEHRKESVLELQKSMLALLAKSGVAITDVDQPTISVTGVYNYTMRGLKSVAQKLHATDEIKSVLVYHEFENIAHVKQKYKSATDAIDGAIKCIDMASAMMTKKVATSQSVRAKNIAALVNARREHPAAYSR